MIVGVPCPEPLSRLVRRHLSDDGMEAMVVYPNDLSLVEPTVVEPIAVVLPWQEYKRLKTIERFGYER